MTDPALDLHSKYQRLASEYSKVRAQNVVLKRAVLEEQERAARLVETQQALRRAAQEQDSLAFRNQQLSCRLALLQQELLGRGSGTGPRRGSEGVDVGVLTQELQAKIAENASLHARVQELERNAPPPPQGEEGPLHLQLGELRGELQRVKEEARLQQADAAATICHLQRRVQQLKLQLSPPAADASPSSSSSSSYMSLMPEGLSKATESPLSPLEGAKAGLKTPGALDDKANLALRGIQGALDSKANQGALNSKDSKSSDIQGVLDSKALQGAKDLPSLAGLSKDICHLFVAFTKALCKARLDRGLEGDLKAKETVAKAQQGVVYWERLAPQLGEVFQRLDSPGEPAPPATGGLSATAASTAAQLRVAAALPPAAAAQAALRGVQSAWSATLPYLSAMAASRPATSSRPATLSRLLALLAGRCRALTTALTASVEALAEDASVTAVLRNLVRVTESFEAALRRRLQPGFEPAPSQPGVAPAPSHQSGLEPSSSQHGLEPSSSQPGVEPALPQPSFGSSSPHSGLERASPQPRVASSSPQPGFEPSSPQQGSGLLSPASLTPYESPPSPPSLDSSSSEKISDFSEKNFEPSLKSFEFDGKYFDPSGKPSKSAGKPSDFDENPSNSGGKASEDARETWFESRLCQLHRQKEHWRLECHLLAHKHAKLMRQLAGVEGREGAEGVVPSSILGEVELLPPSGGAGGGGGSFREEKIGAKGDSDLENGLKDEKTALNDVKDALKSEKISPKGPEDASSPPHGGETWREAMVRAHLSARCSKQFLELTRAWSAASLLQDEAEAAVRRARASEEEARALEEDLETQRSERGRLEEELRTTCRNYEAQMAAMADHLAGLTERQLLSKELLIKQHLKL